MKSRPEIKLLGKERFTQNYWPCVCAALLVSIAIGALTMLGGGDTLRVITGSIGREFDTPIEFFVTYQPGALAYIGSILLFIIIGPLTIGLNYFFVQNFKGFSDEISVGTPFSAAFENFGRKFGGYLWVWLWSFLWSLLFVIPGIIKGYSYAMAPYILSDCPEVRATDALKLSRRIMNGRKWDLFVFNLSFLGWSILSGLTLGILDIFFVGPYKQSAVAGWYLEAREDALRRGAITPGQLNGTEAI